MSANNWVVCPRCGRDDKAALAELDAGWGNLTRPKWVRLEVNTSPMLQGTFREDYEIYGASSGAVTVEYAGECTECHLKLVFSESHPIPGIATGPVPGVECKENQ